VKRISLVEEEKKVIKSDPWACEEMAFIIVYFNDSLSDAHYIHPSECIRTAVGAPLAPAASKN